jgi:hypothetical protein
MNGICDKCKIIKKIGHGVFGITYMVKHKNKKYAMKIQKILKYDLKKSTDINIWREIYFAKQMSKYPDQFAELYCYKIINQCIHLQPKPYFKPNKRLHEYLTALNDSPYCMKLIYDLKDGVVDDLFWNKKLTQNQIYSYVAQMVYVIYLMRKNHFSHNDLHNRNITYKKTNRKYIKLGNLKVKTHRYIYSVIDYGEVVHPSFEGLSEYHHKLINNDTADISQFLSQLLIGNNSGFWDLIRHHKLKNYDKMGKNIRKSKEYKKLKEKYDFTEDNDEDILLFDGIYPEIILKFAGVKKMLPKYKRRLISINDYIFMWKNRRNLKKIITYFTNKANE